MSIVTIILTEVVKRALDLTEEIVDRFGALLAITIATFLSLLALYVLMRTNVDGESILQAILTGIFGGASAAGIYGMTKPSAE